MLKKDFQPIEGSLHDYAVKEVDKALEPIVGAASQEALNSNIFGRALVAIIDTMIGVATTLGTNLTKITKTVKRSELHEFMNSNRTKVMVVDNIPYSKLVGFGVEIPANLQGTYKDAIASIAQIYIRLNALSVAKIGCESFTKIFTDMTNGSTAVTADIASVSKIMTGVMNAAKPAIQACQDHFSGKFQQKANFDDVFMTKEEWAACAKDMLDLEPRLQEAKTIRDLVERMESTLKGICTFAEGKDITALGVKQDALTQFGEAVKNISLIMDGYNLAVTRHLALEHNYVIMINTIYYNVK